MALYLFSSKINYSYIYTYIVTVKLYHIKPMEMLILFYVHRNIYVYWYKNEPNLIYGFEF